MPQNLSSVVEAMTVFMRIIGLSKESLRKFFLRGEFDEFPDEKNMHCTARLAEMLNEYSEELQKSAVNKSTENFLMDEIWVLDGRKGIGLPNFLTRTSFLIILQRKVEEIANTPVDFMAKVWNYIESVVISVLLYHCDSYRQLLSSTRRAAHNLIAKMKEKSFDRVMEIIEMEKLTDYMCSPEYMTEWAKFMAQQNAFTEVMNDNFKPSQVTIEGFGEIEVGHLRFHSSTTEQAFDMKMRITAYWKIVLKRLVDSLALHLVSINELVNRNMEIEIGN
ncbi:Dynamin-related protein 4C [Camellia lanceoleosa]|uniref:Dynamin-related protein 4C n=1 Tax=Camellia lanceoleosa TaxID=1840588 RepID=A0ACC0IHU9_9ERIC|nr:Dynamin-related protein 4C [Camellia lanceoleosa]